MRTSTSAPWAPLRGNCPNGGDHTGGSGGWTGKCTKCGANC